MNMSYCSVYDKLNKDLETVMESLMKDDDDECNMEVFDNAVQIVNAMKEALRLEKVQAHGLKQSLLQSDSLQAPIMDELIDEKRDLIALLCALPHSSVHDDMSIMIEVNWILQKSPYFRALFGRKIWAINKLLNPTSIERSHSNAGLESQMLMAVMSLCRNGNNMIKIVQKCSRTLPFLITCLRSPTIITRVGAVGVLAKLSDVYSLRKMIGESGAIEYAIDLIIVGEGDSEALAFACQVISRLCSRNFQNIERAVSQGVVRALIDKIKRRIYVHEMLETVVVLSYGDRTVLHLEHNDMLQCFFMILREDVTEEVKEHCLAIIRNMCEASPKIRRKLNEVVDGRQTLESVMSTGTPMAKAIAGDLLCRLD
ncbi:hypothetical protein ACS0TY_012621 [Phlomoides rotata]